MKGIRVQYQVYFPKQDFMLLETETGGWGGGGGEWKRAVVFENPSKN